MRSRSLTTYKYLRRVSSPYQSFTFLSHNCHCSDTLVQSVAQRGLISNHKSWNTLPLFLRFPLWRCFLLLSRSSIKLILTLGTSRVSFERKDLRASASITHWTNTTSQVAPSLVKLWCPLTRRPTPPASLVVWCRVFLRRRWRNGWKRRRSQLIHVCWTRMLWGNNRPLSAFWNRRACLAQTLVTRRHFRRRPMYVATTILVVCATGGGAYVAYAAIAGTVSRLQH